MKRILAGSFLIPLMAAMFVSTAISQPPDAKEEKKGAPRFELGQLVPPPLLAELKLTPKQQQEMKELQKDVKERLENLLTEKQKKAVELFRPMRREVPEQPVPDPEPYVPLRIKSGARLKVHGSLKIVGDPETPFTLSGDIIEGVLGDPRLEHQGHGIRLLSGVDGNNDGIRSGNASCVVGGLQTEKGRWYRVQLRWLAQDDFAVERDELFLKVEFFKDNGKNALDFIKKSLFQQVELERKTLMDSGTNKSLGRSTWRTSSLDVRTPFPEVDTLRLSVGFGNGAGNGKHSEFWVSELEIRPIPDPAEYSTPSASSAVKQPPALKSLVKLGGRWYYDPRGQDKEPPKQFDHTNVDRLLYLTDRLEAPFMGNTSAWLRRGNRDLQGKSVEKDQFVPDSVVISFTDKHLIMKSKNLPNHPTAVFPDRTHFLDGNPNIIQEQRHTWYIPLDPKENPNRVAMTMENKRGLPMGPIGVATNGVVFFNPFDHIAEADAVWRLDRCCGHPGPGSEYHYHKYPVCVNTPWADDGTGHSPLIGFAFDGFPVFGPYESAGVLAKDTKDRPLNEFNLHTDDIRGPHYHVTPGKFPHIIGGYWGEVDPNNRLAKKGPPKK